MNIPENPPNAFEYDGKIKTLYAIFIKTLFLRVLTLGIYAFWGKTRLRRYIISSFKLEGDRFEYTGTGDELFRGFLKALFFYAIPFFGITIGLPILAHYIIELDFSESINTFARLIITLLDLSSIPLIIFVTIYTQYAYFRYMISRTQWRGIRFKLTGLFSGYWRLVLKNSLFNLLTFGFRIPKSDLLLTHYFVNNLSIGNLKPIFKGDPRSLSSINVKTLVLFIPTLGLSRLWYQAALNRYRFEHLKLGNIRFSVSQTGFQLLKLLIGNLLIFVATLGFGFPIIYHRQARFFANSLTIIGDLKNIEIRQTTGDKYDAVGEELTGFLETDLNVSFF